MLTGPQQTESYIVGRQGEVDEFDGLLVGGAGYSLLNIYGPGGIGKTAVSRKLASHARSRGVPVATVDVSGPDLTPDRILEAAARGLSESGIDESRDGFGTFFTHLADYRLVSEIFRQTGGLDGLFDLLGNASDPATLAHLTEYVDTAASGSLRQVIRSRFALDRYWRNAERSLTTAFADGVGSLLADHGGAAALLVDTYEEIGALDNWVCRVLVPVLPDGTRMVLLGRNQLTKTSLDWAELGDALHMRPLTELAEAEAKAYLRHYGLTDTAALDNVYRFTGGYPLLLFLVRVLSHEAGGWAALRDMERSGDRDIVASRLLERLLREERVHEVREVLEKCVVATWLNPEVIHELLGLGVADSRTIYEKIQRHSFMERHPLGVKLHDKIRELLTERLRFGSETEYERLRGRWVAYLGRKAKVTDAPRDEASAPVTVPTARTGAGPRVFVAYAHDTVEHKAAVLAFCELLQSCGVEVHVDQWDATERRDWQVWATNQITSSDYVLVVASQVCRQAGDGAVLSHHEGIQAEMRTLRELYQTDQAWRSRILPIILPDASVDDIPLFLQPRTADHYRIPELSRNGIENLLRVVTGSPARVRPPLGPLPDLPPHRPAGSA